MRADSSVPRYWPRALIGTRAECNPIIVSAETLSSILGQGILLSL